MKVQWFLKVFLTWIRFPADFAFTCHTSFNYFVVNDLRGEIFNRSANRFVHFCWRGGVTQKGFCSKPIIELMPLACQSVNNQPISQGFPPLGSPPLVREGSGFQPAAGGKFGGFFGFLGPPPLLGKDRQQGGGDLRIWVDIRFVQSRTRDQNNAQ